jgi:hypothetical protein
MADCTQRIFKSHAPATHIGIRGGAQATASAAAAIRREDAQNAIGTHGEAANW